MYDGSVAAHDAIRAGCYRIVEHCVHYLWQSTDVIGKSGSGQDQVSSRAWQVPRLGQQR